MITNCGYITKNLRKKKKKTLASILHVGCWLTLAITQELQFFFPPNWRNLTKNQTKTELHSDLCLNESTNAAYILILPV
jgi:hypothetical protein